MKFRILDEPLLLDGILYCEDHGCPQIGVAEVFNVEDILGIDGECYYMCAIEVVNRLVGDRRVREVIVDDNTDFVEEIKFDNGYKINPLCACCLHQTIRAEGTLTGLKLVALTWMKADGEHDAICFVFSRSLSSKRRGVIIPMHIASLYSLQLSK